MQNQFITSMPEPFDVCPVLNCSVSLLCPQGLWSTSIRRYSGVQSWPFGHATPVSTLVPGWASSNLWALPLFSFHDWLLFITQFSGNITASEELPQTTVTSSFLLFCLRETWILLPQDSSQAELSCFLSYSLSQSVSLGVQVLLIDSSL